MALLSDEQMMALPAAPKLLTDEQMLGNQVTGLGTAEAFGTGLKQGLVGLAGLPADAIYGARWLARKAGLPTVETPLPGSQEIGAAVNKIIPDYVPKNKVESFAQTAGEWAPALLGGETSLAKKLITRVAAPAAAQETAKEAGLGPAGEAVAGLAGGIGGLAGEATMATRAARSALPVTADLKNRRDQLYKLSELAGVKVKPEAFGNFAADLNTFLQDKYGFGSLAPAPVKAKVKTLADMAASGQGPTLNQLHQLRRTFGTLINSADGPTRGVGLQLYGKTTEFMNSLTDAQLTNPTALSKYGPQLQKQADELHRQYKNSALMDKFYGQAKNRMANYTQAGEATGLRQKFRQLADKFADENSKEYRFFTQEERDAIEKVARGTVPQNVVRALASFAPWGLKGSGITTMLGGAGFALGGPMGGAIGGGIPAGLGTIGKVLFNVMTKLQANKAADLVRGVQRGRTFNPIPLAQVGALSTLPLRRSGQ